MANLRTRFPRALWAPLNALLKAKARREVENPTGEFRLNLGCGRDYRSDYFNVDVAPQSYADVIASIDNLEFLPDGCAGEVMLNAVFEHLFEFQQRPALLEWKRLLRPGGKLILRWIPDFDVICSSYLCQSQGATRDKFDLTEVYRYTHGDPIASNAYAQIHKSLFTKKQMFDILQECGYEDVRITNECYPGEAIALNLLAVAVKPSKS